MSKKKLNKKTQTLVQLLLFIGIILFLNILANAKIGNRPFYTNLDLTEEKRFTLTKATKQLLENLDDVVYVNVLLDGEFPAGFKRLQTAVIEMLDDFRGLSGYVEYTFDDPNQGTVEEINERRKTLKEEGIIPINLTLRDKAGKATRQLLYPYAIFYYKGRSMPVSLLENQVQGVSREITLNNSVGLLEYKFTNALQKLQSAFKPAVVFTTGHGELDPLETADLEKDLRQFYNTGRIHLDSIVSIGQEASALIIAKPRFPFSEKDKFKLDQYVMNGGKVLWLIDKVAVDLDTLRGRKEYYPQEYPLNLDDLLFKYGIRIQPNLVLDMLCSQIQLVVGFQGNQPQFDYFPYPYHLITTPKSKHPIVKSLDAVNLYYPSSIDTNVITKTPIEKTILLQSSQNTRMQYLPIGMDFNFLRYELDKTKFTKPPQTVAMLLEGTFPSAFENRTTPGLLSGLQQLGLEFKAASDPTKMIVVSDGDLAKNKVDRQKRSYSPLGYNENIRRTFANKDFLINAIEYLLDDNGVIEARGKDIRLRMMNRIKADEEKTKWQLVNILIPIAFLFLFGFGYNWIRRRRFAKN